MMILRMSSGNAIGCFLVRDDKTNADGAQLVRFE